MLIYDDSILPKDTQPKNGRFVLTITEQGDNSAKFGNISLGATDLANQQLIKAVVKDFSPMADGMGLETGDVVLFDRYAAYYRPEMKVGNDILIDLVNIICKIDKEDKIHPFGDYVMVKQSSNDKGKKIKNISVQSKHIHNDVYDVIENGNEKSPVSVSEQIFVRLDGSVSITYSQDKYILIPYQCVLGKL